MEYALVGLWLVLYLLAMYVGGSLAAVLFPRFPDRGVAFGVPIAFTVVLLVTYFVGRLSLLVGIWAGVAILVALAFASALRGFRVDNRRYVETAVVFTAGFLFVVWIRALDPAILPIGGEKFLDFGLLQSLLRAETLPPEDMWFAGEPVAYYYGGHLLAAILARLTGTTGPYAYNLALAGFYAMLVTGVYGLAGAIALERGVSRRFAALLSVFAVGFASNLSTPVRLLIWLLPEGLADTVASLAGLEIRGLAEGPDSFFYWDASRVITDDVTDYATLTPNTGMVIDEFPLFAWLNGDLHAHMMSTGFLLLVAGLCYGYYRTPASDRRRRLGLLFGVIPAVGGLIAVTNTWSFPSVGGLLFLTVALAPADPMTLLPAGLRREIRSESLASEGLRIATALAVAAAGLAIGLLWSLPFWLGPATGRGIAAFPDRSSLAELLLVHGLFVVPFGLYLYARLGGAVGARRARLAGAVAVGYALVAAWADVAAVGLLLPLLFGAWVFARSPALERSVGADYVLADGGDRSTGFELVLLLAGAGLVILVEFLFLREPSGRMNTVFKTYMQVWVLWGVAVGPVLAWLVTRWRPNRAAASARTWLRPAMGLFLVVLVVSTSIYGGLAHSNHAKDAGEPTLDGLAHLEAAHPDEAAAIEWLRTEVEGHPTIVTGAPASFGWDPSTGQGASAPASLTGLPTVAGWTDEVLYRNASVYQQRVRDVETIYTGPAAQQRRLLERYDVTYVYVGPAERVRYGTITIGQRDGLTPAHRSGDVVIYRVDRNQS